MDHFELVSEYKPAGDQPEAIQKLAQGIKLGFEEQTLLGVTGSGKTFTMANIIQEVQKPTLVLAHNKTLAAQLCSELREFFPNNAVEFLSRTMTIISRRHTSHRRIPISKKILRSMKKSSGCGIRQRPHWQRETM